MLNIAYKTTRQWNPGDEFILRGCRNLFEKVFGKHNPLIYNCNPDVRPMESVRGARCWQLPLDYTQNLLLAQADCYYRIGFSDNSIKFDSNLSCVDYAVFAGTPEILSHRCLNFYEHIIKYNLPTFVLGAGYWETPDLNQQNVLSRAQCLTFRSRTLVKQAQEDGFSNAVYLPCPALCSATIEKNISKAQTLGLVFGVSSQNTAPFAGINENTFQYITKLYPYLCNKYRAQLNIRIIVHYIDDLTTAKKLFDPLQIPVYYSYDSQDYFDIYSACDLVLSTRVHGCGIAASLGIPSIAIAHDDRAETCKGFLSEFINANTPFDSVSSLIGRKLQSAAVDNQRLIAHKHQTIEKYLSLLDTAKEKPRPDYLPFEDTYQQNETIEKQLQELFVKFGGKIKIPNNEKGQEHETNV